MVARNPSALWLDPDVSSAGVLLSDRIHFYVDAVELISPFDEAKLGPASYDLTLGADCWYADHVEATGESKRVLAPNERLVLEPNSIVYVTSAETLSLPFYLVGRFNLKLRFLHEGLLVGAGPQIDPGFVGRLSCPLHNLSDTRVSVRCGEPFAVIEFLKTTAFGERKDGNENATSADVRYHGERRGIVGLQGYPCITFPTKSLDREPVRRYVPAGRLVRSSMKGLEDNVANFERKVEYQLAEYKTQNRTLNILAYIAIATVAIAVATYFVGIANWYKAALEVSASAGERLKTVERQNTELSSQVSLLREQLQESRAAWEKKLADLTDSTSSARSGSDNQPRQLGASRTAPTRTP